jgi:hypothetical protein
MIDWPDGFCAALVSRGMQLIRFDNRDTGLSSHFPDAPVPPTTGENKALRCFKWVTQREVMYAGVGSVRLGSWSLAAVR